MTYTTNYNLNIVEGTDIVNPLTQLNPNFTAVDGIMKANADATVTPATCIKSGTVHTVTRTNTSAEMFVFTATGDWNTGDTMTVDGVTVTPVLPDGSALLNGSYLINAEVLASIKGTKVTVYSNKYNIASDVIDNLTSTATDKALSANQGNVLDGKIGGLIKQFVLTGTTTAGGALQMTAPLSYNKILNTRCTSRNNIFAFARGDGYFTVFEATANGLVLFGNEDVSIEVTYF